MSDSGRFPCLARVGLGTWGDLSTGRTEHVPHGSTVILLAPVPTPVGDRGDSALILTADGAVLRVSLSNLMRFPLTCKKARRVVQQDHTD